MWTELDRRDILDKVESNFPGWSTAERSIQIERLCGTFSKREMFRAVDALADSGENIFHTKLAKRIRDWLHAEQCAVGCEAFDAMSARQQMAIVVRREWTEYAGKHPDKPWPDYPAMDDDQILALHEEKTRKDMVFVYGHVVPHFDHYRQVRWVWDNPKNDDRQLVQEQP